MSKFKVGDKVVVVGPDIYCGEWGFVISEGAHSCEVDMMTKKVPPVIFPANFLEYYKEDAIDTILPEGSLKDSPTKEICSATVSRHYNAQIIQSIETTQAVIKEDCYGSSIYS